LSVRVIFAQQRGPHSIQPFTLHDNLMLAGGIISSGGHLVAGTVPHAERYISLAVF
jgi:hypothetical protein